MFHNDPLKLASTAINEYDRQTGQHTVALLHSTDNLEDHKQLITHLETKVAMLKDKNQLICHQKETLVIDNYSLTEQARPFFALRDEYGMKNAADIALDRKQLLDNYMRPLEHKFRQQEDVIKQLRDDLEVSNSTITRKDGELAIMESTYTEEMQDVEDLVSELQDRGAKPDRKLKRIIEKAKSIPNTRKHLTKTEKSSTKKSKRTFSDIITITTTKVNGRHMAVIPGSVARYKKGEFVMRGQIILNKKTEVDMLVVEFAKTTHMVFDEYMFTLNTCGFEQLERDLCKYLGDKIKHKMLPSKVKISSDDCLCSY
jgi:uncharacterized coiled-coil protein SlyX